MKKLICSLMVATMLFGSSVFAVSAEGKDLVERAYKYYIDRLNLEGKEFSEYEVLGALMKIGDELRTRAESELEDLSKLNETEKNLVLLKLLSYLINKGISLDMLYQFAHERTPLSLNTDQGRIYAINAICYFCNRFGAVCVLSTGDVIDSNGNVHTENVVSLDECIKEDYWIENRWKFEIGEGEAKGIFYAFFILPDGRVFNISSNKICCIDLKRIELSNRLTVSEDGVVTLNDGMEISPERKEEINDFIINVLKDGIAPIIFRLIRHGNPTRYVTYMMIYLCQIDEDIGDRIYGSEDKLLNYVAENFCYDSIKLALSSLHKRYETARNCN